MQGNMAYCQHLFDDTTDGYIEFLKIGKNKEVKIYNTNIKGVKEFVEVVEGEIDTYVAPNTMYKPFRRVKNIRQFRALYIDLDHQEGNQMGVTYQIIELAKQGIIPMPSMAIDSGRGVHLYWRIVNAPYGALHTWQELEDMLYNKLKKYGADIGATDGARLLRIPGTINSKNNQECRLIYNNDEVEYSMYDLREKYLNYKPIKQQLEFVQAKKSISNKVISNNFFNSYSLHISRAEDLLKLCELRKYKVIGHRNMILHCFAYWKGIYTRDIEELEKEVIELNNAFTEPLKECEVNAILRCVPKAIDKFIKYEQGMRNGERKKVTKGMRDKEGYWYKNETLIESLKITENEESQFKTIIGIKEKYKRKNLKRTPRNENGLTSREQQKQNTIKSIQELYKRGYKQVEIVKELNLTKGRVSQVIKKII
ncbi:DNA-binding response regulator [Clostridium estertheticum]|uniref:DNA-binding response regulator n=1 Tax=Clostridium estertheticum TaxID=238834 RepID=A0A7Y3T058_9CLOT|nr:DNA-binding response regulator [Clostridium estertheticum]NNU78594.1 DNA-binding response regulator [Clostridium estertheticum]WBL49684.1 DNA-binding response regulator [Clostridium estertheticum]